MPHTHAFPFCLARLLSPTSSRHPPCAIGCLPPQIVTGLTLFPLQPSRLVCRTPNLLAQDQPSPHRIGRHQNRKTPLLYVAHVTHCPWPSSLEAWTLSQFRRISAGYGFAQVNSYALFDILFCFGRSALHSLAFPIRPRPCFEPVALFLIPRRLRDRRRARD